MSNATKIAGDFGEVLEKVATQASGLPSDLVKKASEQLKGEGQEEDPVVAQRRQEQMQAREAQRKLPGLTERELKIAAQKIAEVRKRFQEEEREKAVQKQVEEQKKAEKSKGQMAAEQNRSETRGGGGGIG